MKALPDYTVLDELTEEEQERIVKDFLQSVYPVKHDLVDWSRN